MEIPPEELLRGYGNPSLQQMARQRGFDIKGKGKRDLVQLLAPTLYAPDRIGRALADLEPVERLLLDRLIMAGADAPTELLRHQLEGEGRVDPRPTGSRRWGQERGSPWERGSRQFEDVVARLGVLGLAFSFGAPLGSAILELHTPGRRLAVPYDILKHLPEARMPAETVDAPPEVRAADAGDLLRDGYTLLAFACRSPIPLTARGQIAKRTLVQIDESLQVAEAASDVRSEEELGRIPFLRAVLEDRSLLMARPGRLEPGEEVEQFLNLPAGERLQLLYDAYLQTLRWCELFRIPDLSITTKSGRQTPPAVVAARRRVLAELAELPTGEWVPLAHLVERMRHRAHEFLIARSSSSRGYSSYGYEPNPYEYSNNALGWTFDGVGREKGWDRVEAGFLQVMVLQPLHWLGILDLGFSEDQPAAFRLTSDGARLLRGEPLPSAPAEPRVVVQPNFQIFAFPPTSEGVLYQLDRFAERVRAEQVVEYRLARESVYRAQRSGMDAAAIVAFLEQVSSAPLPQNVRRTLEEWGAQHERIVVRQGSPLLQAADEATLDALYADPDLGSLLGRRVAPAAALVPAANLAALYQKLLECGPWPALSEGTEELDRPLFTVDGAGRIIFRHRVPSVYVLRALRPFAEEEPEGSMRLTAAGLRRAAGQGIDAEQIIATLERWHAGPLAPEVPAVVRRWAKDWGRGALVEAVLLQVQRAETMADLLADPELGPHLKLVAGSATLATVQRPAIERLRSALEDRGMALGEELMG